MRQYVAKVEVKGSIYYTEGNLKKGKKIRYRSPAYEETYLLCKSDVHIELEDNLEIEDSLPRTVTNTVLEGIAELNPSDIKCIDYLGVTGNTITIVVKLKPNFNLTNFHNPTVISKDYWQAAKVNPESLNNPNLKPLSYWAS
jgi:hypothetical protein